MLWAWRRVVITYTRDLEKANVNRARLAFMQPAADGWRSGKCEPNRCPMTGLRHIGPEFDEFVRASSSELLRLAVLLSHDRGHAEDLLQTSLVRTAARWSAARRNPRAYCRRVLVNLAKDRWRDRSRQPREVQDLDGLHPAEAAADARIAATDHLSRLVAQLPIGQRKILVLRYFEDLSVAEVAIILGCSEGNVKSQAHRGLATLRDLITEQNTPNTMEDRHAYR
jgi:RNA polymerase sigma-70 factor (sigma-E family)